MVVPKIELNLLVARICAGRRRREGRAAGQGAAPARRRRRRRRPSRPRMAASATNTTVSSVGSTAGVAAWAAQRRPSHRRAMSRTSRSSCATASGVASCGTCWLARDVAVRDEDGAHPGRLRTEDVLVTAGRPRRRTVRARRRSVEAASRKISAVRLHPGRLAGVDVGVDEVEHPVALEEPAVVVPGPDGVGQHSDADPVVVQSFPERPDLGVGPRVRLPEPLVCREAEPRAGVVGRRCRPPARMSSSRAEAPSVAAPAATRRSRRAQIRLGQLLGERRLRPPRGGTPGRRRATARRGPPCARG